MQPRHPLDDRATIDENVFINIKGYFVFYLGFSNLIRIYIQRMVL